MKKLYALAASLLTMLGIAVAQSGPVISAAAKTGCCPLCK